MHNILYNLFLLFQFAVANLILNLLLFKKCIKFYINITYYVNIYIFDFI